jgi:retinol dehydrogenase-12
MGVVFSGFYQTLFPGKSHFTVDDIPDLSGRVAIVTGGNSGIGFEIAKALLEHNAKVYLASRNAVRVQEAVERLEAETGNRAVPLIVELTKMASVKAAAEEFLAQEKALHMLFNNAGMSGRNKLTEDGYDLVFCGNTLGPAYFTQLLIPALLRGAAASPDGKSRVVNLTSVMHVRGRLDFETLRDSPARRGKNRGFYYAQSKFGNIVFSNEFARQYGEHGIVSTSVHPGSIDTNIYRTSPQWLQWLVKPTMFSCAHGALTPLWAGTSPETVDLNGKYLVPWARVGTPAKATGDPALGKKLWDWVEAQVRDV